MKYRFCLKDITDKEKEAFRQLADLLRVEESVEGEGALSDEVRILRFEKGSGLACLKEGKIWTIRYGEECEKWRGFGRALEEEGSFSENGGIDLQVMFDCSRNGVLTIEAIRQMIRHLALMGYRAVQLYTEDTYCIEGEPYFGYQRGRYSREELQEIDHYAALFGIEVIPCIQTLAHLERVLHWQTYEDIRDCEYILLAEEEKTYELIDKMFAAMSEALTSRRINIGMDEAHALGLGKYLEKHGFQKRMDIMLNHFQRVWEIARRYGYRPMMWSDMFFRLACGGEYYAGKVDLSLEVADRIPKELTLVYWDYYSLETDRYDEMLSSHKLLTDNIAFAGGVWTWTGFCPNSFYSRRIAPAAWQSCSKNGIDTIIITAWGDDGTETSLFSALPGLQQWAELSYGKGSNEDMLEKRFATCVGASYSAFLELGRPVLTPHNPDPGRCGVSPVKYLLYQDVLGGLFDAHVSEEYGKHFEVCAQKLSELKGAAGGYGYLFELEEELCRLLADKSVFGIRVRKAYAEEDGKKLRELAENCLPQMKESGERFLRKVEQRWQKENKVFGLDVIQIRMGGLLQRMSFASKRLLAYCDGTIERLEELEDAVLPFRKEEDMAPPAWRDTVSGCNV